MKNYKLNLGNLLKTEYEPNTAALDDTSQSLPQVEKSNSNFTATINSFITTIMNSACYKFSNVPLQQQIQHLSFIVNMWTTNTSEHLLDIIMKEHKNILDEINNGIVDWDNAQRFRDWEQNVIRKLKNDVEATLNDVEAGDDEIKEVNSNHDSIEEDENKDDTVLNPPLDHEKCFDKKVEDVQVAKSEACDEADSKKRNDFQRFLRFKKNKNAKKCDDCCFITPSQRRYDMHMFDKHAQNKCKICDCDSTFTTFNAFYKHTLNHREGSKEKKVRKPQKCPHPDCEKIVIQLEKHIQAVHEKKQPKKKCPHCGETKYYGRAMRKHIRFQHDPTFRPVNCPGCGILVKDLERHMRTTQCNVPEEERKVIPTALCEICCKVLKTKKSLKLHMKAMHGNGDDLFQCDKCSFKTKYKPNLRMHIKTVHDCRPTKELCKECNTMHTNLEKHIENYHKEIYSKAGSSDGPSVNGPISNSPIEQ